MLHGKIQSKIHINNNNTNHIEPKMSAFWASTLVFIKIVTHIKYLWTFGQKYMERTHIDT